MGQVITRVNNCCTETPRLSDPLSEVWNSLMAAGRNDFLWRSAVRCGGIDLFLNELLCSTGMSPSGWVPRFKDYTVKYSLSTGGSGGIKVPPI